MTNRIHAIIGEIRETYLSETARWRIDHIIRDAAARGIEKASNTIADKEVMRLLDDSPLAKHMISSPLLFHATGLPFVKRLPQIRKARDARKKLFQRRTQAFSGNAPLWAYTPMPQRGPKKYTLRPSQKTVFYLLNNCRPYNNGGYAVRAHGILRGLQAHGFDPMPIAHPGYPSDSFNNVSPEQSADIDGITYRFLGQDISRREASRDEYAHHYAEQLRPLVEKHRPSVLHAASFHFNGHAALKIRERYGIPVIYEVRGLSVLLDMEKAPRKDRPAMFPSWRRLWEFREEVEVAKAVDHLLCITEPVAALFEQLGVPRERISLLPNAAEPSIAAASVRQPAARENVLGYFGSLQQYEGIENLCAAIEILARTHPDLGAKCLIVGDGPHSARIADRVRHSPSPHLIELMGRVPNDEIQNYFQRCAAMVYPRLPLPVCELISPLKPFEPMAHGVPVIASDVAALMDIVRDGKTGFTFAADDPEELAHTIVRVLTDREATENVMSRAREYVQHERNWKKVCEPVAALYDELFHRYLT